MPLLEIFFSAIFSISLTIPLRSTSSGTLVRIFSALGISGKDTSPAVAVGALNKFGRLSAMLTACVILSYRACCCGGCACGFICCSNGESLGGSGDNLVGES